MIGEKITEGHLSYKDKHLCDTLENTLYCLAKGSYLIKLDVCSQYKKTSLIVESPFRKCSQCCKKRINSQHSNLLCFCPMIKRGNGAYNRTDGSIIVGQKFVEGVVLNTEDVYLRLYSRIRKHMERGAETEIRLIVE